MNVDVDAALAQVHTQEVRERLTALIDELYATMEQSAPLGRRLIKLTVSAPAPEPGQPRRGYRRIGWIEWALEPMRTSVARRRYENLVSALAVVIGWESFIVLSDMRGLKPRPRVT